MTEFDSSFVGVPTTKWDLSGRIRALLVLTAYWGIDGPRCMWPDGCNMRDIKELQINHIYGNGSRETKASYVPIGKFYWAIIREEYSLFKVNILCRKHNGFTRFNTYWNEIALQLLTHALPYDPNQTLAEIEDMITERNANGGVYEK